MRVVVDTCALFDDVPLLGLSSRIVLERAKVGGFGLVVPEVVVIELVNEARERLEVATEKVAKGRSSIVKLGLETPAIELETATLTSRFDEQLRARITESRGVIAPIPAVDHRELVVRSAEAVKPFRESGVGYRDALIWQTVLAQARDDEIVFVSSNTRDFAADDRRSLHPDLVAELRELGLHGRVELETTLKAFIAKHIPLDDQALTEARQRYEDEPAFAAALRDDIAELLADYEAWAHQPALDLVGLDGPAMRGEDTPEAAWVEALYLFAIAFDQAYEFDAADQTGLLEITADAEVTVGMMFHKSDAEWLVELGADASIDDFDYNETMATASNTLFVRARCNALLDRANRTLSELSVISIENLPTSDPAHPANAG